MRRLQVWLAIVALAACTPLAPADTAAPLTAPVAIEGGRVRGVERSGVTMFGALPYAAPPVGARRWRPPSSVTPWGDVVRAADHLPPECPQVPVAADALFAPSVNERSEDCLYLNVWTNARGAHERRPVMVWLHGGGFMQGSSAVPMYDGAALARRGVVFVSINYRLGVLGFLAHPKLTAESPRRASGNYGLLDQIAALEWVKRNIAQFGGDPGNVTVIGQSAGSMSLSLLTVSPLARGLFHKGIGETGASMALLSSRPLAEAEARGAAFAQSVGARSLSDLRAMDADDLARAAGVVPGTFEPIVDGWVLPAPAEQVYHLHDQVHIPLLLGSNSHENPVDASVTLAGYRAMLSQAFGEDGAELLALNPAATDAEARDASRRLMTIAMAQYPMHLWATLHSESGTAPLYLYRFTRSPPVPQGRYLEQRATPELGAWHGAEIAYALDNLSMRDWPWRPTDRRLSALMASYWVNFARTGNPNGPSLPEWPVYSRDRAKVMKLGEAFGPMDEPNLQTFRVLDRHYRPTR